MKDISIKGFQIGNDQDLTLMGGMNVLESEETTLLVAEKFKEVTEKLDINWIFKASFDRLTEVQLILLEAQVWMKG